MRPGHLVQLSGDMQWIEHSGNGWGNTPLRLWLDKSLLNPLCISVSCPVPSFPITDYLSSPPLLSTSPSKFNCTFSLPTSFFLLLILTLKTFHCVTSTSGRIRTRLKTIYSFEEQKIIWSFLALLRLYSIENTWVPIDAISNRSWPWTKNICQNIALSRDRGLFCCNLHYFVTVQASPLRNSLTPSSASGKVCIFFLVIATSWSTSLPL